MSQIQTVTPQNDIADFLKQIIKFLEWAANFFDSLSMDVQAQGFRECSTELAEHLKADAKDAAVAFLMKLPDRLTSFVQCSMAGTEIFADCHTEQARRSRAQNIWVSCLVKAAFEYLRSRDANTAVSSFITCILSGTGGGGGNGGGGNPGGGPQLNPVTRCN